MRFQVSKGLRYYADKIKHANAYQRIVNALVRYEKQVDISANERLAKQDLEVLQKAIRADYPELWWFDISRMATDESGFIRTISIQ